MKPRKKTKIEEFKPGGILAKSVGKRRYSLKDVATIARTQPVVKLDSTATVILPRWWRASRTGKLKGTIVEVLAERLEIAAALYLRDEVWAKQPTLSDLNARFQEIRDAAEKLLRTLGLGARSRSSPALIPYSLLTHLANYAGGGFQGPERVKAAAGQIKNLYDWSNRAIWAAAAPSRKAKLEFAGDKAFNRFLIELGDIWSTILSGKARVSFLGENSSRRGQPCGPFFEFVNACLTPLPIEARLKSPKALGSRLRRLFNRPSAKH